MHLPLHMLLELPPFLEGIRTRFSTGGSLTTMPVAFGGLLMLIGIVYLLTRAQQALAAPAWRDDPRELFEEALKALPLDPADRELLRRRVQELNLPHPATVLLVPQRFSEALGPRPASESSPADPAAAALARVHRILFATP